MAWWRKKKCGDYVSVMIAKTCCECGKLWIEHLLFLFSKISWHNLCHEVSHLAINIKTTVNTTLIFLFMCMWTNFQALQTAWPKKPTIIWPEIFQHTLWQEIALFMHKTQGKYCWDEGCVLILMPLSKANTHTCMLTHMHTNCVWACIHTYTHILIIYTYTHTYSSLSLYL